MLMLDRRHEYQLAGDGRQHLFLRIKLNCSRRNPYLVCIGRARLVARGTLNIWHCPLWIYHYFTKFM